MQKLVNRKRKGFTLVEIIIVVVIIGILAALIIPRFGDATAKAKKTAAIAEHRAIVGEAYTLVAEKLGKDLDAAKINTQMNLAGRNLPHGTTSKVVGGLIEITTPIPSKLEKSEQAVDTDAATKGGSKDTADAKITYIKVK